MASPRPNRPGAALGHGTSDGYDEEARKGQIIPTGSRSQPGTPIGIGLGLRELLRIPLPRTSVNKGKEKGRDVMCSGPPNTYTTLKPHDDETRQLVPLCLQKTAPWRSCRPLACRRVPTLARSCAPSPC